MTTIETETSWVASLPLDLKLRFFARLSWTITIAGRNSYEAGTDELTHPRQLRRVNEVQHRVTACLYQLLDGTCPDGFTLSIAQWVLAEPDDELRDILQRAWGDARTHVGVK